VADRVQVFELHILPMFRMLDHDHMLSRLDLWDRTTVWQARSGILDHLKGIGPQMPTLSTGGPWPSEWIALFERWTATGDDNTVGHHLELLAPDSGQYELQPAFGGKVDLIAKMTAPTPGYTAWFELKSISANEREYVLYGEPPFPAQPAAPTAIQAVERLKKAGLNRVFVTDSRGRQQVDIV